MDPFGGRWTPGWERCFVDLRKTPRGRPRTPLEDVVGPWTPLGGGGPPVGTALFVHIQVRAARKASNTIRRRGGAADPLVGNAGSREIK